MGKSLFQLLGVVMNKNSYFFLSLPRAWRDHEHVIFLSLSLSPSLSDTLSRSLAVFQTQSVTVVVEL